MRILNARAVFFTLVLQFFAGLVTASTPSDNSTPILWDPGLTQEGTQVVTNTTTVATNYLYRITTANPSLGAWRTALAVTAGEANLFLSRGVPPTTAKFDFKSDRTGSDGIVISSSSPAQFAPNEVWYILVQAQAGASFSLVSGAPYVQDIGTVASDDSSGSGDVTIGPEGILFFSAAAPTDMLAWRLWLNGKTNTIYLKKSSVPLTTSFDLSQAGQTLVVPPYLSGGQQYFIGVTGDPGTKINLDSRQQPIIDLAYGSSTASTVVTNFPYTTYRIQVPAQQIAWRISIPATDGNPNVSLRRNTVANESNNDATSELAPPLTDNIALVPPILSDGTFYVTVWSTNSHTFTLNNGPAVVTDINYIDTITNDDPDRVGWRYYRVTDISQQLGTLGWQLSVSNFAPGTRIAIRRNAAPSIWSFKNPNQNNATYYDLISVVQTLQDPGHQADVWYIGVYNPTNSLGAFTLTTRELDPGPLLTPWQTVSYDRTNVVPGVWEYFRLDLPPSPIPGVGWDLRLQNVTGSPILVVRRDAFPTSTSSSMSVPVNATNWNTLQTWAASSDWTQRLYGNVGNTNENGRILTMPLNRPLQPGKYYVGVQSTFGSTQAISFRILSRWIGATMDIPVRPLNLSGDSHTNTLSPREAAYYSVEIPPNTRSFKARVRTLSGEAMVAVNRGVLPNTTAGPGLFAYDVTAGKTIQKKGDEYITLLPPHGAAVMTPGTYYIAVIGEGQNPPDANHIGAGDSTYVIETMGSMAEPNLGLLANDLTAQGSLAAGESAAYHFNTDTNVVGFWVTVENATGSPVPVSRGKDDLADPGLITDVYGNDGGQVDAAVSGNPIKVSDPFPTETVMVKARATNGVFSDATYTLRISPIKPTALDFDGGSLSITNADADHGVYFQVDVPPGALGWDLRLTNVTTGSPRIVVRRDFIPTSLGTSISLLLDRDTNWVSAEQWAPGPDWTGRSQGLDGTSEDGRIMAVGMGRPLEPGRYYVAVFGIVPGSMSFTIRSRGIGDGYTIPVTPLDFNGGTNKVAALAPREAAYYSVDVPQGAASWKVHLSADTGESLLIASQSTLPNLVAGGNFNITNTCGHKMQKFGDEYFVLLPPPGTNVVMPGRYYLTVVSEGQSPTATRIGANPVAFTITSVGLAPIRDLGQIGVTDLVETNSLGGGDTQIYQFSVPAGTLGIEARLEDRVSNPVMVMHGGPVPGPAGAGAGQTPPESYGNESWSAPGFDVHPALINVGDVTNLIYTLVVMARSTNSTLTNASYTLRLNASGTTTLALDGGSSDVTNHTARTWKYFRVTVPSTIDGWDLRLQNVIGGQPRMVIRREGLPSTVQTSPWSQPGTLTNWPVNAQWAPSTDWTRRSYSFTNANTSEDGRVFAVGMGRPLEAGNYFIGVYNNSSTESSSYTILSRGIGHDQTIPLIDIPFVGSYSVTLPAREAAYFRVVVPSNSPNWKVKMTGDSGEAMMVVLRGNVPNIDMNQASGTLAIGKAMQKPGNEHFMLVPAQGQTNLPSTTNYFAVISEGLNPPSSSRIGTGSSSFTFQSEGSPTPVALGLLTSEDLVQPDRLEAGEVKIYKFLVPSGTLGFKIRLENRQGNPAFVLRYGDKIPDPSAAIPSSDVYGTEGGYTSTDGSTLLYTVPNPAPGLYTLAVKGRPNGTTYTDAGYTLRVQEILIPELNFSELQNTNGLPNGASGILDDNERVFYKVIVPPGSDVAGWKLVLSQSSGLATMRVRKDLLPSDANSSQQMQFTSAEVVVVPPYLTNGVWYVEVKGTGSTAFQLTSNPLDLQRPIWSMPEPGQPVITPGVVAPLFGDTGIDTNGVALPGDSSTFLEQGTLHYYAVSVPTNNYGVLRAVLEAISGNPDLYLRFGAPPTLYHNAQGSSGTIYDRSMLANATEYANWVPLDGKVEARLKPGLWYLAVRAAGNANTRYRLKLSSGNVTELPVHGPLVTNQLLAGGDWRYYKFTAPDTSPGGFNVQFSEQSGDVVVYLRDTVPPGNGNTGSISDYKDWNTDNKNQSTYKNFDAPGTYSFAAPPVRPGSTYYVGVRAVSDAVFSVGVTTNGAPNVEIPAIDFYGGTMTATLTPGAQTMYRVNVPPEATRWRHSSSHALGVIFSIEQGTFPTGTGIDNWRSPASPNTSLNQYLLSSWPWVPGQSYFITVTNSTAQLQDITFAMDGRNYFTDDNDADALPDAWELQYFGNIGAQIAAGDPDKDGVTNYDEYLENTNPTDPMSFRPRLVTASIFGTIIRSLDLPSYDLNSQVTLTASPDPGYAFTGWLGSSNGLTNPLIVTMDGHKNFTAMFKLAGDDFVTALPITGDSATIVASNVSMTKEPGEPNHAGNPGGKSIWWHWTANSTREVTLTTAGTPFSTLLGVYTGSKVSALTTIASDSNSGGVTNRSIVKFNPAAGQTYFIAVDGLNGASGRIDLSLTLGGTTTGIAPTLGASVAATGAVQFGLAGTPNFTYSVETSTNLVDWVPLGSVTTDATGAGSFTHSNAPTDHSFYRTR